MHFRFESKEDVLKFSGLEARCAFAWITQEHKAKAKALQAIREIGYLFHRGGFICVDTTDMLIVARRIGFQPRYTIHVSDNSLTIAMQKAFEHVTEFTKGCALIVRGAHDVDEVTSVGEAAEQLFSNDKVDGVLGAVWDSSSGHTAINIVGY